MVESQKSLKGKATCKAAYSILTAEHSPRQLLWNSTQVGNADLLFEQQ